MYTSRQRFFEYIYLEYPLIYYFPSLFFISTQPLQIKSVVAPEHVKGYIYIEAYKQTHVKAAIEGVGNLRMGYWNQQMVPIKEMTDVLKVVKEVTNLKPKSWVRLKRGLYKDDIAQVGFLHSSL